MVLSNTQAYRAQLLRNIHQPAKFVFMDMILADNIQHLTENIGFKMMKSSAL